MNTYRIHLSTELSRTSFRRTELGWWRIEAETPEKAEEILREYVKTKPSLEMENGKIVKTALIDPSHITMHRVKETE